MTSTAADLVLPGLARGTRAMVGARVENPGADFYPTPPTATLALLAREAFDPAGYYLEPAAGRLLPPPQPPRQRQRLRQGCSASRCACRCTGLTTQGTA